MSDVLPALVAVSLKAYLSSAETRAWVSRVAGLAQAGLPAGVEVAVLPAFPLLESTASTLAGTPVRWGAQDVAPSAAGNQTGEVTAALLAELGCRYVEVGHAERRRLFGDDRDVVLAKLGQVVGAGLVPVYCLGEDRRGDAEVAAADCSQELEDALTHARATADDPELVVAYEPVWAIGAREPAPAHHVGVVCTALRDTVRRRHVRARVIYGGSAGPGLFADLAHCTDGLFLGRFAHDPGALAEVLDEVASTLTSSSDAADSPPPAKEPHARRKEYA